MIDFTKLPLFSFRLGATDSNALLISRTVSSKDGATVVISEYKGGIRVTSTIIAYPDYDAVEWVSEYENVSGGDTEVISELFDCDVSLPLPHEDDNRNTAYLKTPDQCTKVYFPFGSTLSEKEFFCNTGEFYPDTYLYTDCLYPGKSKYYADDTGRPSEKLAPFFNVSKDKTGVIGAIGWTGQWHCRLTRSNDALLIKTGIRDANFKMLQGEKLKTSSFVLMEYEGLDFDEAQNKWRRLVKSHFSPFTESAAKDSLPLACGLWGGMSTGGMMKRLDLIEKGNIPETHIWIDAGWYGSGATPSPDEYEGDWGNHTGDWRVNTNYHPDGLKNVTDKLHDMGKKLILWFEPERVKKGTPITREHPEYFIIPENGGTNWLLNLGDVQARKYCLETISESIRTLRVDCYRQDFNFRPISYWQQCDAPDRKGVTEIKYVNGLYEYLDALKTEFPSLMIDNCASGGRRLDIEMTRRSVPLWRSDFMCSANFDPETVQTQSVGFGRWLAYSGTGAGRTWNDTYYIRSCYAGAMTTNYTYSERDDFGADPAQLVWMKKHFDEYLSVRDYFHADIYPLTDKPFGNEVWCAVQYNRPEKGDGLLTLFRRSRSPYDSATYKLRGLDANKRYVFRDLDGGGFECDGKELLSGFRFVINAPRTAKFYIYSEK